MALPSSQIVASEDFSEPSSTWLRHPMTRWHAFHVVWHIINYEPSRKFMVPKFMTYDEMSDSFDHIMYYRQLMTLDIRNDALLCKVFSTSLHDQTFSWFHCLSKGFMDNFWDLSKAFVGHYLCSTCHKQNINTLQNIKMQENESLRDFVKRFR